MASNVIVFQATHDDIRLQLDIYPGAIFVHDFEQYRTIQVVLIGAQTKQTTKLSKKHFF
jgi:hypothetical protein